MMCDKMHIFYANSLLEALNLRAPLAFIPKSMPLFALCGPLGASYSESSNEAGKPKHFRCNRSGCCHKADLELADLPYACCEGRAVLDCMGDCRRCVSVQGLDAIPENV